MRSLFTPSGIGIHEGLVTRKTGSIECKNEGLFFQSWEEVLWEWNGDVKNSSRLRNDIDFFIVLKAQKLETRINEAAVG